MKVTRIIALLLREETRTNLHGNEIHDMFLPAERYWIDFADDFESEGWEQYDTDQDAPYFGVWVNPSKLMTLTYAEGDWSLVTCKDKEFYNTQIESMNECYEKGFIAKVIDSNGDMSIYRQDRDGFLIT